MDKKCKTCGKWKDIWYDFTKTNKDGSHYEVDVCKFCRMGGSQ